jgi:F0F1-type ATP synthase assembly protein I
MLPTRTPKKKGSDRDSLLMAFGIYGAVGLQLVVALLAGVFLGNWLDRKWGTAPWLLFLGIILGCGGGFYNLFRLMKWKTQDK